MNDDLPIPDFDGDNVADEDPTPQEATDAFEAARRAIDARNATSRTPPLNPRRTLPAPSTDVRAVIYEDVPHPGFDARFGAAFRAPFVGFGTLWLVAIATAVLASAIVILSPKLFVLAVPALCTLAAALQAVHFGQAANAGMHDEGGAVQAVWAFPDRDELSQLGLAFAFGAAALLAPAIGAAHVGRPWLALLGVTGFLMVWPMALTGVGISGSVMTLFRPILILKTIARTFRLYVRVAAVAALLLLPPIALCLVGEGLARVVGALLLGPAVAYASGVVGFMMGCLAATRVETFRAFRS